MKYNIHYAALHLDAGLDIPCYQLEGIEEVRSFVNAILGQHPEKVAENMVYLIGLQDEIIITKNCQLVQELFDGNLNSCYPFYEGENIFIQEYESYQDAYAVALDIKEEDPLRFNKDYLNN